MIPEKPDAAPLLPAFLQLAAGLSGRARHAESITLLRQALSEPEPDAARVVGPYLIDELVAADQGDEALTVALDLLEPAPDVAVAGLCSLLPSLRPAAVRPSAARLSGMPWTQLFDRWRDPSLARDALAFAANALLLLRDYAGAVAVLESSSELTAADAELSALLGDAHLGLRHHDRAFEAFGVAEHSIARTGNDALQTRIGLRLAELDEQLGRPGEALARLERLVPDNPRVGAEQLALVTICRLQLGHLPEAERAYAAARRLRADSLSVARAGTHLYIAKHEYAAATRTAEAGLSKNPGSRSLSFLQFQADIEAGADVTAVEKGFARFLQRLDPGRREAYEATSVRMRPSPDPALRYFVAALRLAAGRGDEALAEVEQGIALVDAAAPPVPAALDLALRKLHAELLEPNDSAAAALEYAAAGRRAFEQGELARAVELFEKAAAHQELDQQSAWMLADSYLVISYAQGEPMGVEQAHLKRATDVWQRAFVQGDPEQSFSWVYLSRARMSVQRSRVQPGDRHDALEALRWGECFYVTNPGSEIFYNTYAQAARTVGAWAMCADLFRTGDGIQPDWRDSHESLLANYLTNAGQADAAHEVLAGIAARHGSAIVREGRARAYMVADRTAAALDVLDEIPKMEKRDIVHLVLRALCDWRLGRIAEYRLDLTHADSLVRNSSAATSSLAVWIQLFGGHEDEARTLLATFADEDTWLSSCRVETAFCDLVKGDAAASVGVISDYIRDARSLEDVQIVGTALEIIGDKFGPARDAAWRDAVTLLHGRAEARRNGGGWPTDVAGDLEHLSSSAPAEDSRTAAAVVTAAGARIAVDEHRWNDAIDAYRFLHTTPNDFPEAEAGLIWVARAARQLIDPDQLGELTAALESARRELRRDEPRGAGQLQLELSVADLLVDAHDGVGVHAVLGDALANARDTNQAARIAARGHVCLALIGHDEVWWWLARAARACRAAAIDVASTIGDAAAALSPDEGQWRRLLDVWAGTVPESIVASEPGAYHAVLDELQCKAHEALALVRFNAGQLDESVSEYGAVLESRIRRRGAEDPSTLTARLDLATMLWHADRREQAEQEYHLVVAGRSSVLGPDHPDTLAARRDLAAALSRWGRLDDAVKEYRDIVAARERLFGSDDVSVADARFDLGTVLMQQGAFDPAADLFAAVTGTRERALGQDDPATLSSRNELAWARFKVGDLDAAEADYETVIAARRRVLGDAAPATLATRYDWASILAGQQRLPEAEAEFRAVADGQRVAFGEDAATTLATRHEVGVVLVRMGRFEDAAEELGPVVDARTRVLGPDDPLTLTSRAELAWSLANSGRSDAAEAQYLSLIDDRSRVLGENDPATLSTQLEWARILRTHDRAEEAVAQFRAVIIGLSTAFGSEDPTTLSTRQEFGSMLSSQREFEPAARELEQVLDARLRTLGTDDPDTLATRSELAWALAGSDRPNDAEDHYRILIDARRTTLGENHPDTLATRSEWATVLKAADRLSEAEAELRAIVSGRTLTLGPDDAVTLQTRYELAMVLGHQGRLDEAAAEFRAVTDARSRSLGPDDPNTLMSRYYLANVLSAQSRFDEAIEEYHVVLAGESVIYGPEHANTLTTRHELADATAKFGDLRTAEGLFAEVVTARARTLGADHPATLDSVAGLTNVRDAIAEGALEDG